MSDDPARDWDADPYTQVPVATSWRERRRVRRERAARLRRLQTALDEARETLRILSESDRVGQWRRDVEAAQAKVRSAWAQWIAVEEEREERLAEAVRRTSAVGVPVPTLPTVPPGALGEVEAP